MNREIAGKHEGAEWQGRTGMKNCEARLMKNGHTKNIKEYQLFDSEGTACINAYLCSKCVESDIEQGWDWRIYEINTQRPV